MGGGDQQKTTAAVLISESGDVDEEVFAVRALGVGVEMAVEKGEKIVGEGKGKGVKKEKEKGKTKKTIAEQRKRDRELSKLFHGDNVDRFLKKLEEK